MNDSLGTKVRNARREAQIPPEVLAVALGVSVATVFRIERDVSDISVKRLGQIAEVTGQPISYFIGNVA